jgi:hypothetical protein
MNARILQGNNSAIEQLFKKLAMKKLLMYSFVLLLCSSLSAQHTGIYAGLNGAFQKSAISCSDDSDAGGQLDFENTYKQAFGFDLGYNFDPKIGIQTGVIYSQQGQKYITVGVPDAKYVTDLRYLKFPVLFCYHLRSDKKLSFLIQAGFQLSLLLEAKSSRENAFGFYTPKYVDVKDYYTSLPVELAMGIGLQYTFKKICMNLLIRPDYSISDIEKTEKKPGLIAPASNFTLGIPQLGFQYYFK